MHIKLQVIQFGMDLCRLFRNFNQQLTDFQTITTWYGQYKKIFSQWTEI